MGGEGGGEGTDELDRAHVPELQRRWLSPSIPFSGLVYKEDPDHSTVSVPAPQIVIHVSADVSRNGDVGK